MWALLRKMRVTALLCPRGAQNAHVRSGVMRYRPLLALTSLFVLGSLSLAACGDDGTAATTAAAAATSTSSSTSGAGGSGGESTTSAGGGGAGGEAPAPKMKTISGDMTWQVDFDATAEAAGATDCSYTRHYEGQEDTSLPWFCPECEVMFSATVEMTAGLDDCFPQVSPDNDPSPTEYIGYGNGKWFRAVQGPMGEQGTAVVTGSDIATMNAVMGNDAPNGGLLDFAITGTLATGEMDGDPTHGWKISDTYNCGWPKADPPEYTGDWSLAKGQMVPDGWFKDACEDVVRIHDFKGSYLVIDMSAMDCPPCQDMASAEEQFVTDMEAQGIEVHVITLLAPSLSDVLGETTTAKLNTWINKYDLTSPVLADRGWGLAIFSPALGAENVGYPSYVIVDPELNVLDFQSGYGGFAPIEDVIVQDAQ